MYKYKYLKYKTKYNILKTLLGGSIELANFDIDEVEQKFKQLNTEEIKVRSLAMQRAIRLGNNQKRKVKIIFEDDQAIKKVETTIWAVTEKNILLKRGVAVPINRIHQVSAY